MNNNIHLIGIGGSGFSAIARILVHKGWHVSGSDNMYSPIIDQLRKEGVKVFLSHDPANIQNAELVVRSSAIQDDNPEVIEAKKRGLPVLKRVDFLKQVIGDQKCIAIAGSHGKTTTTAMVAWLFYECGMDPSYIIGGISKNLKTNAYAGSGEYFIIEADEYDHMFLGLEPDIAVITNVDYDHPDCFPTPEAYQKDFVKFINQVKPNGSILYSQDNPGAVSTMENIKSGRVVCSYGVMVNSDYLAINLRKNENGGLTFGAVYLDEPAHRQFLATIDLRLPGAHNVRNALAAMAVAHRCGIPPKRAAEALAAYTGTERRFDIRCIVNEITIIDDYAHHPTEIRSTLSAAREAYPNSRIVVVWQPHTYSRVQALENEFSQSFTQADQIIVTEIYAAREKQQPYSSIIFAEKFGEKFKYFPNFDEINQFLIQTLKPGDLLMVLSAGDANAISAQVASYFQQLSQSAGK